MKVNYSSDGEYSADMDLSELIDNLAASEADIDLTKLRQTLESGQEFRGFHDFGQFVVKPI